MRRGIIAVVFVLFTAMVGISVSAQEEKVLKVTFDGANLSVTAVNAGAEELLQAMAREVKFKLTTAGLPPTLKADVNFENVPLGKGIDRVIRALRIKTNVSHVAVYEKQGEKDVLYSLRVTGSSGSSGPPPMGPPGKAEKMAPRPTAPPPLPPPPPPAIRKGPGEQEEAEQKRRLRREMEENILKKLREEGLTEEEIMERLRGLLQERE